MTPVAGGFLGVLGFIKPEKFHQVELGRVEGYLQKRAGAGKEIQKNRHPDLLPQQ